MSLKTGDVCISIRCLIHWQPCPMSQWLYLNVELFISQYFGQNRPYGSKISLSSTPCQLNLMPVSAVIVGNFGTTFASRWDYYSRHLTIPCNLLLKKIQLWTGTVYYDHNNDVFLLVFGLYLSFNITHKAKNPRKVSVSDKVDIMLSIAY